MVPKTFSKLVVEIALEPLHHPDISIYFYLDDWNLPPPQKRVLCSRVNRPTILVYI